MLNFAPFPHECYYAVIMAEFNQHIIAAFRCQPEVARQMTKMGESFFFGTSLAALARYCADCSPYLQFVNGSWASITDFTSAICRHISHISVQKFAVRCVMGPGSPPLSSIWLIRHLFDCI